jgi:phage host-nuclease inhibitor protein Gam
MFFRKFEKRVIERRIKMGIAIAEDMKKLTENIIISNDVRLKAVGELVSETHKTLKGFAGDRKKMAAEQANDLADFVNGLSKNVQSLLKKAQTMLNEFHKSNSQMGKEQAKSLSDFVNKLTSEAGSMLSSFEKDRGKMSKELKNKLAREIKDIQTEVKRILNEADKLVGEYSSDIAQARKSWKAMCGTLAKARKSGLVMPKIETREKVTTVGQAINKGKKRTAKKSESNRQTVHAGV